MTKEEKKKAIDALKISAPVRVVTQEEFNDYIQTLNKIMDWLVQEPCEDAISRQAVLNKAFEIKTGKNTSAMVVYAEDIRKELPVKPKLAFNEQITIIPMPFE